MAYLQDVYFANLNVVCHVGGAFSLRPQEEWQCREHAFIQNKFYYITGGRCRIVVEGQEYIGEAGTWFFIPAGTRHRYSYIPGEPLEKQWVHFDIYPNAQIGQMLQLPYVVHVGPDDPSRKLFENLSAALQSEHLEDRLNAKAYVLQLLACYIRAAGGGEVLIGAQSEERIQGLLAYIHEHLDEPLTVDALAARCYLHPNHFIRYFRGQTGQTPARYVAERRLESAKRLLEETDLPIAEVMDRVGMQESGHFARLFRKRYLVTPTEYRRRYRAEQQEYVYEGRR